MSTHSPQVPTYFLHRLHVKNFKSYRDVHMIGPFLPFTCIVGPNGSGKSNILDAICFVLGLESHVLRARNVTDFVCHGVDPSTSNMYVEAIFKKTALLNEDSEAPDAEISFLRSLESEKTKYHLAGAEVTKQVYTDKLREIGLDTLLNNFIVMQGDVDRIAVMTPMERTQWFERISRSDELKEEYEQLKERCEQNDYETNLAMTKKRAVSQQQRVYQQQKAESEKFNQLVDERNATQTKAALFSLFHLEKSISQTRNDQKLAIETEASENERLKDVTRRFDAAKRHEKELQRAVIEQEQQLHQLTREKEDNDALKSKDVSTRDRAKERVDQCTEKIERHKQLVAQEERDVQNLTKQIERNEWKQLRIREGDDPEVVLADNSEVQPDQRPATSGTQPAATSATSQQIKLTPAQRQEYLNLKKEVERQIPNKRAEVDKIEPQLKSLRNEMEKIRSDLEHVQQQQTQFTTTLKEITTSKLDAARNKEAEAKEKLAQAEQEYESAKTKIETIQKRQEEVKNEIERSTHILREGRCDIRESQKAAFFASTLATLQRLFPGIKGTLHELVDVVRPDYGTAITAAMGVYMDAIVVEKEETARECLAYIHQQRIGPSSDSKSLNKHGDDGTAGGKIGFDTDFTFLPLDTIQPKQLQQTLRLSLQKLHLTAADDEQNASQQEAHLVYDLLTFDPQYQQAVLYAVGNTVVLPTLENAMQVCFETPAAFPGDDRPRMVTLDGDIISKQGFITCGSASLRRRAQVWGQKEISKAKRERNQLLQEKKDLLRSLRAEEQRMLLAEITSRSMKELLINIHAEVEMQTERKKKDEQKLAELERTIKDLQEQDRKRQTELTSLSGKLSELYESIHSVEDAVFETFCKNLNIRSIRVFEQIQDEQNKQRDDALRKLQKDLNSLKSQKDLLTARSSEFIIKRDEAELKRAQQKLAAAEAALEKTIQKQNQIAEKLHKKEQDKDVADDKWRGADRELAVITEERQTLLSVLGELKIKAERAGDELQRLRSRREALVEDSRMDEVYLPIVPYKSQGKKKKTTRSRASDATDDFDENAMRTDNGLYLQFSEPINLSQSTRDSQAPTTSSPEERAQTVQINFESISNSLKNLSGSAVTEQQEKYRQQLREINSEIEAIVPNLKASEQLKSVEEKLAHLTEQHARAQERRKQAQMDFQRVKEERRTRFIRAFQHISDSLDSVYAELTRTKHGTVGHAMLEPEHRGEEPYLGGIKFHTMPPSKGFREMEALSGGEKAIAALAFLFAFNSYHPSPFLLLDEVDDALDSLNVASAARYIRSRASGELYAESLKNLQTARTPGATSNAISDDTEAPTPLSQINDSLSRFTTPLVPIENKKETTVYPLQCIVISLKGQFFEWADSLVGVSHNSDEDSSQINTLDLRDYIE